MDLSKILLVAGKPGLYELVTRTKTGAIVQSLIDGRRTPVFQQDRISSVNEISLFTTGEEKPLREIFQDIYRKEDGKDVTLNTKQANSADLYGYLSSIVPDYDEQRVHASDVRKLISWYNLLNHAGLIDLEQPAAETPTEAAADEAGE